MNSATLSKSIKIQKNLTQKLLGFFASGLLALSLATSAHANEALDVNTIAMQDLDGQKVSMADYKGKWVIVNLWATWCPPCIHEIPDLVDFHEKHSNIDAVVLGVNYEDIEPQKVKTFAETLLVNYPLVRFEQKPDGVSSPFGLLKGLPTTYMVSPDGKVVAARTGMVDAKMLEEFIRNYNAIR